MLIETWKRKYKISYSSSNNNKKASLITYCTLSMQTFHVPITVGKPATWMNVEAKYHTSQVYLSCCNYHWSYAETSHLSSSAERSNVQTGGSVATKCHRLWLVVHNISSSICLCLLAMCGRFLPKWKHDQSGICVTFKITTTLVLSVLFFLRRHKASCIT